MDKLEILFPCPFCGGVPFIYESKKHKSKLLGQIVEYGGGAFIECSRCTCAISAETREEAIKLWNTRHGGMNEEDDGK